MCESFTEGCGQLNFRLLTSHVFSWECVSSVNEEEEDMSQDVYKCQWYEVTTYGNGWMARRSSAFQYVLVRGNNIYFCRLIWRG